MAESQLGDEPRLQLESGALAGEPEVLTPPNGDDDVDYDDEELGTSVEGADTIAHKKVGKRRSWATADCWMDTRAQQGTLSGPL